MTNESIWKQAFDIRSRAYEVSKDENIHGNLASLYFELEAMGSQIAGHGGMDRYQSYDIQLEDGSFARMQFITCDGEPRAMLDLFKLNGEVVPLITKTDLMARDYKNLNDYLSANPVGIGHRFPEKLKDLLLEEFTPGRLISFDLMGYTKMRSYVCVSRGDGYVTLKEAFLGNFKDISAEKFMNTTEVKLYLGNPADIQSFYNNIKTYAGNILPRCEDIGCFAQEQVNAVTCRLRPGKSAVLTFGSERLHVKKSLIGNRLTWYDKNGHKITESAAKVFIAWCHNAPVAAEIKDENKLIGDKETYGQYLKYERHIMDRQFLEAAVTLEGLCSEKKKDFAVNFHTYGEGDDMKAVSFCFKSTPEGCDIYRIYYRDDDFRSEPERITKVELSDFIDFCTEKFIDTAKSISDRFMEEFEEKMARSQMDQETKNRIIANAAERSAEKEMEGTDVIGATEISDISEADNSLIESYMAVSGTADDGIIYDEHIGMSEDDMSL